MNYISYSKSRVGGDLLLFNGHIYQFNKEYKGKTNFFIYKYTSATNLYPI